MTSRARVLASVREDALPDRVRRCSNGGIVVPSSAGFYGSTKKESFHHAQPCARHAATIIKSHLHICKELIRDVNASHDALSKAYARCVEAQSGRKELGIGVIVVCHTDSSHVLYWGL